MKYDVKKIKEIADRLGVSEKTVMQYLRCRSPLQPEEREAGDKHSATHAEVAPRAKRPTSEIMPGHLHG